MPDVQENPLALQIRKSGIGEEDALVLQSTFSLFLQEAEGWKAKAESIVVQTGDDKQGMKEARDARLALREIRINVEKRRKEMKEASLRKGQAIDSVANFIKSFIEPLEDHLQQQEDFAKIQEEKRLLALKEARIAELSQYAVDPSFYDIVAKMPDETFAKLLETSKVAFEGAKAAAAKEEQDRLEKERADADARERMRLENERLRKENLARQQEAEREKKERERVEAGIKAEKDAAEKARKEREEEQRQQQLAPDKEKLIALAARISGIELPEVSSDEAKVVLKNTIDLLSKTSQYVKTQSLNL